MIVNYELDYSLTYGYSVTAIDEWGHEFPIKHIDSAKEAEKYLQLKLAQLAAETRAVQVK